jgi:hypothetical protein
MASKKVLSGNGYTRARLAGILHESYIEKNGGNLVPQGNVTVYGEGTVTNNATTDDVGLIVDVDSIYFGLSEPHLSRLVDVVDGDGWMDTVSE